MFRSGLISLGVRVFLAVSLSAGVASAQQSLPNTSTADHSQFKILQQDFKSGPEVTEACVSCHTQADDQFMHSIHFTWEFDHPVTGQKLGKRNVVNSFCGNVAGNEARCTSCHAGYGWEDMSVTPQEQGVTADCLVCHDTSGQYTKADSKAGHPPLDPVAEGTKTITGAKAWAVDLTKAAQSVGTSTRENCGNCHFYGGGGDNVKHGDLSSVLYNPSIDVDVHMSPEGENMTCSTCHVSDQHQWSGSRYNVMASDAHSEMLKPGERRDVATCQSCHGTEPHPATLMGAKLNNHTDMLACQTCHIPAFAKGGVPTKTKWDWSTAGRLDAEGKPIHEDNYTSSTGAKLHTYLSTKGDFEYGENVEPYYAWFDGQVEYATRDREIAPSSTVEVNSIKGARGDGVSRIWPFKRMEGRQAYDTESNKLVFNHVWGPTTDTALWTNFDWGKSIEAGMKAAGQPYSGNFDFVDTYMYWPITHMVAPADQALKCGSCHSEDGRLEGVPGVHMPGTRPFGVASLLGIAMVLATIAGVLAHIALRVIGRRRREH
ncbi:tetrathionate reductase family octaheme c-type cytochrome [Lentibacter sp. XHP0401]|uniref:tetrathionate reductase family octaheme c-type cytochrome n=1 Tax=Lentibacter sp. XHP0401 TaxID=2984334 RepID=UPI0021E81D01|nr:tetrathionate reductase family octaheme c-type cytochrome [Lentibacter sp. XHP0401]MCV2892324.1 tetrathionate reductase family octaheme c-type cytochrome [Lentibacter sp. XHP0401]